MRQSVPYSQQQNRWYYPHHHRQEDATTTDGRTWHQYHNANGYYGNHHSSYNYPMPPAQRQNNSIPSHLASSWTAPTPDGKRKFNESESAESSPKTRQKVETEIIKRDDKPTKDFPKHPGYQTSYRSYERNDHLQNNYKFGSQRHGYGANYDNSMHRGSWQRPLKNQYYASENTPPLTAGTSGNNCSTVQQEDLTCKGCLRGKGVLHLKLFHDVLTQALYSNPVEPNDVMTRQIPGCALVYEGLCFGFEKDDNDKWMVVRGTGCLGMAQPNRQTCLFCERQQPHVEELMQTTLTHHTESPQTICQSSTIHQIKMVPTLAETKMRQMECEIQDLKENSITVVNV